MHICHSDHTYTNSKNTWKEISNHVIRSEYNLQKMGEVDGQWQSAITRINGWRVFLRHPSCPGGRKCQSLRAWDDELWGSPCILPCCQLFCNTKSYMTHLAWRDDWSNPWIPFFYYKTENSLLVIRICIYRRFSIVNCLGLENYCQILLCCGGACLTNKTKER